MMVSGALVLVEEFVGVVFDGEGDLGEPVEDGSAVMGAEHQFAIGQAGTIVGACAASVAAVRCREGGLLGGQGHEVIEPCSTDITSFMTKVSLMA